MDTPLKVEGLLVSTHEEGIPNWTSQQQLDAYSELKRLYVLWYRKEIHND
jgi:hypothetical protein